MPSFISTACLLNNTYCCAKIIALWNYKYNVSTYSRNRQSMKYYIIFNFSAIKKINLQSLNVLLNLWLNIWSMYAGTYFFVGTCLCTQARVNVCRSIQFVSIVFSHFIFSYLNFSVFTIMHILSLNPLTFCFQVFNNLTFIIIISQSICQFPSRNRVKFHFLFLKIPNLQYIHLVFLILYVYNYMKLKTL